MFRPLKFVCRCYDYQYYNTDASVHPYELNQGSSDYPIFVFTFYASIIVS